MASEGPTHCTWSLGGSGKSPHNSIPPAQPKKILDNILDHIGNTPLVRINNIGKNDKVECEILAKCEYFNAGGSVKDRIGKRMVEDAERSGRLKPGDVLIEPTSGNTGIGLALAAAIKGYRCIITLPEKMSNEKVNVLKALGAEIIRTPTEAAWDSPDSHIGVAARINRETPNSHILDQYKNPSNPLAHYDGTAEELVNQTDGRIDYIFLTAGTGGTITGIARKLKEKIPNVKVIGVDPYGSILAQPESLNSSGVGTYAVEGIGYDFIPTVLERKLIDGWVKTEDKPSFIMSRRLIREEGLLCGGSSGSVMYAAIDYCKKHNIGAGKRIVVLLPDSVRNYMTKFLSDDWMVDWGFMEDPAHSSDSTQWWWNQPLGNLSLPTPLTISPSCSCKDAIEIMKEHGFDQLPVVDEDSKICGMLTEGNLTAQIVHKRIAATDPVGKVVYKNFKQVGSSTTLGQLSRIFDREPYALVVTAQKCLSGSGDTKVITEKKIVAGVVTRIDLLNYLSANAPKV